MPSKRAPCNHCGRVLAIVARGLCGGCYHTRGVRDRYEADSSKDTSKHRAMTEEQLDAMIAERMKKLPKWWTEERERINNRTAGPRLSPLEKRSEEMRKARQSNPVRRRKKR